MKTLVFLFVVVLSINCIITANHNRRHGRKTTRDNEDSDPGAGSDVEWPSPASINDFTVPDEYTGGAGNSDAEDPGNNDEAPPARHHGKNHHRSHGN